MQGEEPRDVKDINEITEVKDRGDVSASSTSLT